MARYGHRGSDLTSVCYCHRTLFGSRASRSVHILVAKQKHEPLDLATSRSGIGDHEVDVIEYRPRLTHSLVAAGVWLITASILAWLGLILGPEDRGAMDGLTLLLFTVVPIRLFSWTMATVFAALGVFSARRGLGGRPSLVLSSQGLVLRSGRSIPWSEITSTEVTPSGVLLIDVESRESLSEPPGVRSWFGRLGRNLASQQLALSSFELGTSAEEVVGELERCLASTSLRGGEV